jgi:hypothetical protein
LVLRFDGVDDFILALSPAYIPTNRAGFRISKLHFKTGATIPAASTIRAWVAGYGNGVTGNSWVGFGINRATTTAYFSMMLAGSGGVGYYDFPLQAQTNTEYLITSVYFSDPYFKATINGTEYTSQSLLTNTVTALNQIQIGGNRRSTDLLWVLDADIYNVEMMK